MSRTTLFGIGLIVILGMGAVAGFLAIDGNSRGQGGIADDPVITAGRQSAEDCTVCHALYRNDPHRVGPSLWGIVGAEKARMDGYAYSRALATAEGVWSVAELDAFLKDPHGFLPGTRMVFEGLPNDAERGALLSFLTILQD